MTQHFSHAPAAPRQTVALAAALQGIGGGLGWSIVPPLMPQIAQELSLSHGWAGLAKTGSLTGSTPNAPPCSPRVRWRPQWSGRGARGRLRRR